MASFRNPFDRLSFGTRGTPRAKPFTMPNQPRSQNDSHQLFERYSAPSSPQSPEQRPATGEWDSYLNEVQDLYTRVGPAQSAYREHIANVPQYQKPGIGTRLGAALVGGAEGLRSGGAAGWAAGQNAVQAPYRRQMEDWGVQEQALSRSADIEDEGTNRRLQFMKEVRGASEDSRDYDLKRKRFSLDETKEGNDEYHREAQRARWADEGYKEYTNDKGDLVVYKPGVEGSERVLGPSSKRGDWARTDAGLDVRREGNRLGWANNANSRINTEINRSNASINAGRYQLEGQREERAGRTQDRLENPSINAGEQSAARESALNRASMEKLEWRDFLTEEGQPNPDTTDPNDPEFQSFMKRVSEIETGIFGRRRNLGTVQDY